MKVGELRKIILELDDDYEIELRVRTLIDLATCIKLAYPYPYKTEITELVFDDVGVSDKKLCLGCQIKN